MRILVTGGTGFIGSHVIEKLLEENHKPVVLTKDFRNCNRIKHLGERVDIYNSSAYHYVFDRFNDINAVIHLATLYKKDDSGSSIEDMIKTNIEFPTKILDEMVKRNVQYFINTGTFFEYPLDGSYIDEFVKKRPYNLYASTKLAFEEVLNYYSNKGIKKISLKLFSPYGPRDNPKLITSVCRSLVNNQEIDVGKGDQELSWTYVKDIADAYIIGLDYVKNTNYDSFNIGSESVKLNKVFDILEEISGKKGLIKRTRDYSLNEVMFGRCNSYITKNTLKWEPKYSLEDGLKETYDYYLENKDAI